MFLDETNQDWSESYTRPQRLITDVRTREFQYKFMQDVLVNKYWLFNWKISNEEKTTL